MKNIGALVRHCAIFLMIIVLFSDLFAQRWGQTNQTNWRDREVRNGRRELTYSLADPHSGTPNYFRRAVESAIRKWNDAQNYEGALRLIPTSQGGDIRIQWWDAPREVGGQRSAGLTTPRQRDGHMDVFLSARVRSGGRFFTETELQNMALHELGHAEGLDHDARLTRGREPRSPAMYPYGLSHLSRAKWTPNDEDISFKRQLYATVHEQRRPRIDRIATVVTPIGGGYLYTYTVPLEVDSPSPLSEFAIFSWAEMTPVDLPKGWEGWFSPPAIGEELHEHPASGAMTVFATVGFELLPGEEAEFVFFSSEPPEMGWVYGKDVTGELTLLGETSNILTPTPEPVSLVCLLTSLLTCWIFRKRLV